MISTDGALAETNERFEWYMGQLVQALIDAGYAQYAARLIVCRLSYQVLVNDLGDPYLDLTLTGPFGSVGNLTVPDSSLSGYKNGEGLIESLYSVRYSGHPRYVFPVQARYHQV